MPVTKEKVEIEALRGGYHVKNLVVAEKSIGVINAPSSVTESNKQNNILWKEKKYSESLQFIKQQINTAKNTSEKNFWTNICLYSSQFLEEKGELELAGDFLTLRAININSNSLYLNAAELYLRASNNKDLSSKEQSDLIRKAMVSYEKIGDYKELISVANQATGVSGREVVVYALIDTLEQKGKEINEIYIKDLVKTLLNLASEINIDNKTEFLDKYETAWLSLSKNKREFADDGFVTVNKELFENLKKINGRFSGREVGVTRIPIETKFDTPYVASSFFLGPEDGFEPPNWSQRYEVIDSYRNKSSSTNQKQFFDKMKRVMKQFDSIKNNLKDKALRKQLNDLWQNDYKNLYNNAETTEQKLKVMDAYVSHMGEIGNALSSGDTQNPIFSKTAYSYMRTKDSNLANELAMK
jgi:hypothetical protein